MMENMMEKILLRPKELRKELYIVIEQRERLETVNTLRERVRLPLSELARGFRTEKTAAGNICQTTARGPGLSGMGRRLFFDCK